MLKKPLETKKDEWIRLIRGTQGVSRTIIGCSRCWRSLWILRRSNIEPSSVRGNVEVASLKWKTKKWSWRSIVVLSGSFKTKEWRRTIDEEEINISYLLYSGAQLFLLELKIVFFALYYLIINVKIMSK